MRTNPGATASGKSTSLTSLFFANNQR
jgi:hypothetical protein